MIFSELLLYFSMELATKRLYNQCKPRKDEGGSLKVEDVAACQKRYHGHVVSYMIKVVILQIYLHI